MCRRMHCEIRTPRQFKTRFGGLFLFLPYLHEIGLDEILDKAGLPVYIERGVKPTLFTPQAPSQAFQQICSVSSPLLQPV
jgi:hypothetical protein